MTQWLVWTLLTVVSWGIWAVLPKLIADEIQSPSHIQAASTIGILPVLVLLWMMKDPRGRASSSRGVWLALGAGIVSCLGNIAYFDVYGRGGKATEATAFTALYPAVTVLLAIPILKERLNRAQLVGVCLSLVAIYLFNVPGESSIFSTWLLVALFPVVLWGVCGLMQKISTDYISARSSAIWFLLAFLPVAVFIIVRDPLPSGLSTSTWALAAAIGFTLALGNFTVLLAFASGGKASIVTPMAGMYPLVSIPIAMFAFDEKVGWRQALGIVCATLAVIMLSYQSPPTSTDATSARAKIAP
jgi:drug/metabolite transporter (DMT)-like permease